MWDSNSGLPDPEPAGLIFILQRVTDRESGRGSLITQESDSAEAS